MDELGQKRDWSWNGHASCFLKYHANFMRKCFPLKRKDIHYPKNKCTISGKLNDSESAKKTDKDTELCTCVFRTKFANLILKCLSAEYWFLKDEYITRQFTSTQTKLNLNRVRHNITGLLQSLDNPCWFGKHWNSIFTRYDIQSHCLISKFLSSQSKLLKLIYQCSNYGWT